MKRYQKYKDSGIEWVGDTPEHWDVKKLKRIANLVTGATPTMKDEDNYSNQGLMWIKPDNLSEFSAICKTKAYLSDKGEKAIRKISSRMPLVCCIGGIGKFGFTEEPAATNQQINAVIFDKTINIRFGLYLTSVSSQEWKSLSNTNVVPILNSTRQGLISYSIPPFEEQKSIAEYLDCKTSKIDDLIAKKECMTELLKEERTAIINNAVTKGLDPDVEMKDSGIEWLGEIPKHWEIKNLKYLVTLINEVGAINNDGIRIDLENIECWTGQFLQNDTLPDKDEGMKQFIIGDVLFNKLRPYLAKVFYAKQNGICGGELLVLRPSKLMYSKLLYYRAISNDFIRVIDGSTYGAKMPRASWDFIGNLFISYPEIKEQTKIVNYIDQKTKQITDQIEREQKSIELLREYRTALILEVVTGKIDVRNNA
ncbi:MAG: restriction endonuclease subunit S [Candidatus Zapsychrus exili]|nr:restriction endonuclease subunit S [Candidatus Zapsychrus exili]